MSSFPSRRLEIWKSSRAEGIVPIHGAFFIGVIPTLMVQQTIEFIYEQARQSNPPTREDLILYPFFRGMIWYSSERPNFLIWFCPFKNAEDLFQFNIQRLFDAIKQLELHMDVNLIFNEITYLADIGTGPQLPLMTIKRLPIVRGYSFELEERVTAANSLRQGDLILSDKAKLSHQHYSTGMALLAGEDTATGLIDGAFMQFYLATEALLEKQERGKAIENGRKLYGSKFSPNLERIVEHVYLARHRFFGHAHPKYLKGIFDPQIAFDIAKQILVAKWCARYLLGLELNTTLVIREMFLFPSDTNSIQFNGQAELLDTIFALPS
jgi:hypothetical protein